MLCSWLRLLLCEPAHVTRLPGSASGPWFAGPHSPWSRPLAPLAPRRRAPLSSQASQLLWASPTSLVRSSSASASGLPGAVPAKLRKDSPEISRFPSRGRQRMPGSTTTRSRPMSRDRDIEAVLPSAGRKASALRSWFSPLNGWPTLSPVNASLRPSRVAAHELGGGVVRYAFTAEDSHGRFRVKWSGSSAHQKNSGGCFGIQGLSPIS